MVSERSRYGLLVSALGATSLAVSVYLPWYGLRFATGGIPAGQFAVLSAHQALADLGVVLPGLAGLALLDSLIPLARPAAPVPAGGGASVLLLGSLAAVCVLYRMVHPPAPAGELLILSLREGAWVALLGSLAMVAGGLWPRSIRAPELPESLARNVWPGLSSWTPER
jgi:hypothetical protein